MLINNSLPSALPQPTQKTPLKELEGTTTTKVGGFAQALTAIKNPPQRSVQTIRSNITNPNVNNSIIGRDQFTPLQQGIGDVSQLNKSGNYYKDKESLLAQALRLNGMKSPESTAQKVVFEEHSQNNKSLSDALSNIGKILSPLSTLAQALLTDPIEETNSSETKMYANVEIKRGDATLSQITTPNTKNREKDLTHIVEKDDTLIGIMRKQASASGYKLTSTQEMRLALDTAKANNIADPNKIYPGQLIDLISANKQIEGLQQNQALALLPTSHYIDSSTKATNTPITTISGAKKDNPVLTQTLERAVTKGYIPTQDRELVYENVIKLAKAHQFQPDDFARMTLMESDGMNPRASNDSCHGIIQFCDGPNRGAASVGYANKPRTILDLSVNDQLALVDRYFTEVGLKNKGPMGLEDLYLSVLKPSAREELAENVNLQIPGKQAKALYVKQGNTGAITRESIRNGLIEHSHAVLGTVPKSRIDLQALKVASYRSFE